MLGVSLQNANDTAAELRIYVACVAVVEHEADVEIVSILL